jgi:hypothetical protein
MMHQNESILDNDAWKDSIIVIELESIRTLSRTVNHIIVKKGGE